MRKEDFPVSEEKLRRLAGCLRQKLSLPSEGKKAVYINLSMVRLQLAWILPKFIYAAGIAAESGCRVYVLSWRENPLLSELAESFGFQLICLNKLSFEHPLCGFRAFAKTAGFMIGDGSGDGLKELRCLGLYAGRNMYEDILRTSELSTLRSARNGLCMKKMLHILWMLYALDAQLKKAPPAYVVADDVAYHEALQLALFHKHGAKICNVSTKKEEEIRFDAKGSVIRRHQSANTRLKLIKEDPPGMEEELEGFLEDLFAGKAGRALDRGAFKGKQVFGRRELEERLGLDGMRLRDRPPEG